MIKCPKCKSILNGDYISETQKPPYTGICPVCTHVIPSSEFGKTAESSMLNEDCSNYDKHAYLNPGFTADVIPMRWNRAINDLEVLLIKRKYRPFAGMWATPGGFYDSRVDKEIIDIAAREAREETGLSDLYLIPMPAVGSISRDPRQFTVTAPYIALLPTKSSMEASAADDADDVRWWRYSDLPDMAFDHASIIAQAYTLLSEKIKSGTDTFIRLLQEFEDSPSEATMSEVQNILNYFKVASINSTQNALAWISSRFLYEQCGVKLQSRGRPAAIYTFTHDVRL